MPKAKNSDTTNESTSLMTTVPRTDIPHEKDWLKMSTQFNGLSEFIRTCRTPMTIAIQGDWGIGKTSAMKNIQSKLKKTANIPSMWFETWQFSALGDDSNIFLEFITTMMSHIGKLINELIKENEDKAKKAEENGDEKTKTDAEKIVENLKKQQKTYDEANKDFKNFIKTTCSKIFNSKALRFGSAGIAAGANFMQNPAGILLTAVDAVIQSSSENTNDK